MMNSAFYPSDAERSVIGGLIQDNSQYAAVSEIVTAKDFYNHDHKIILNAIERLHLANGVFDLTTLDAEIRKENILSLGNGDIFGYLAEVIHATPSAANIKHYAKIVKEQACRRELLGLIDSIKLEVNTQGALDKVLSNLRSNLERIAEEFEPRKDSSIVAIEFLDLLAKELPPRELILTPWLPKAGLAMIHARPGIGKTHLSLNIAYAAATGGSFLGWQAEKPAGVLFIDGEMPAITFQERGSQIFEAGPYGKYPKKLLIINPDFQRLGMPDLGTKEGQEMINEHITEEIDLVIVDNLSCLVRSGKENDSDSWQPIQTWALNLRAKGKSVLFIHHQGKSGSQRGSSKKEDVLDTVISLKRPDDYDASQGARFVVTYEKSRGFHGEEAKPFEVHLVKELDGKYCWKTRSVEESNYEKVVSLANDGFSQTEIAVELDLNKSTVSRHIAKAKSEGLIRIKVA